MDIIIKKLLNIIDTFYFHFEYFINLYIILFFKLNYRIEKKYILSCNFSIIKKSGKNNLQIDEIIGFFSRIFHININ